MGLSAKTIFLLILAIYYNSGGGNTVSTVSLNALSSIPGITLPSKGQESSKHGLVLA